MQGQVLQYQPTFSSWPFLPFIISVEFPDVHQILPIEDAHPHKSVSRQLQGKERGSNKVCSRKVTELEQISLWLFIGQVSASPILVVVEQSQSVPPYETVKTCTQWYMAH